MNMKKMLGLMILFFALGLALPSQAQSVVGEVLKIKSKEAREKIKEKTQNMAAEKNKADHSAVRKWGTANKLPAGDKGNTKEQLVLPPRPEPIDVKPSARYVPVDTSQHNPW
ncbi:MAG: hypothetical protein FD123_3714 [Bacteroidetes bacterium]|nr:MAG: hypothetical protein FD123_3714 [Bacteroidota bacterium]